MTDEPTIPSAEDRAAEPSPTEPAAAASEPAAEATAGATDIPKAEPIPAGESASEAWGDVLSAMAALGTAVTAWAQAAVNEPDNRRHLDDLRSGVNEMAKQADVALSAVRDSDFGKQVADGAQQAGDAIGQAAAEIGQTAAPHIANAFAGLADVFGRAAQRVGEAASSAPTPKAPDVYEPPQPKAPEAPAPAEPSDATDAGPDVHE